MTLLPAAALGPAPAGACHVGIRPEMVRLEHGGLPATVEHTEYLGADTNVALRLGGHRMMARFPGQVSLPSGAAVAIGFDRDVLHFFDPAGLRLHRQEEPA